MIKITFEKQDNGDYLIKDYSIPDGVTEEQKKQGCIHKAETNIHGEVLNIGGLLVTRGSVVSVQIYDSIRQRVELSNKILEG